MKYLFYLAFKATSEAFNCNQTRELRLKAEELVAKEGDIFILKRVVVRCANEVKASFCLDAQRG